MRIPRHWRLNPQRYALQGVTCPHCSKNIFPPREVCPYCENRASDAKFEFTAAERKQPEAVLAFEQAAR